MKKLIYLLIVSEIISASSYSQNVDDQKYLETGIYPAEALNSEINTIKKNWLVCKPISLSDINNDFSNINDLKWIQDIAKTKNAIFIGENHFNKYTQNLRNRILFALNESDYFPIIILEEPFPITSYANYYLHLQNDNEANLFFENELFRMIPTKEEYDLLHHIRRWNKSHPNKIISIGYEDVDKTQDELSRTINQIIIPYFQKIDPNYFVDWKVVLSKSFDSLIFNFRQNLEKAKTCNLIGKYSFITPHYISTVIDNLESSNKTLYKDYFFNRQKAILRNLTDTNFLGKYLQNGKIILQSGSWHLKTKVVSDSINNLWEGTYLTNVFDKTKGKTYSLKVDGIARSLEKADNIKYNYIEPALGFNGILEKLKKAQKDGIIIQDHCYFINIYDEILDEYSKFWIQIGRQHNWQGLLIESIQWDKIINKIKSTNKIAIESFTNNRKETECYDKELIIPCSPLVTPILEKK
jgi:hypothetical protein